LLTNFLSALPVLNKKHLGGTKMGFIAQEAENIIPEVVNSKNDHYTMLYAPITALLVEAMKEQQKQIESQQVKMNAQQAEIELLKKELLELKKLMKKE
jgi:aspartate/methionine/tyrosine aminotransferase